MTRSAKVSEPGSDPTHAVSSARSTAKAHDKTLRIPKIERGVVVDHVPAGRGPLLLELLRRVPELAGLPISIGLNYESIKLGRKDVLKVHDVDELPARLLQQVAIVSPGVTVKRIAGYQVAERYRLEVPARIQDLVRCRNPSCITNHERHLATDFATLAGKPLAVRCRHCERIFKLEELERILH